MPRLQILQHKSYHPYLESNKQRVRDDEAKAAQLEQDDERRALDQNSTDRLAYLRNKDTLLPPTSSRSLEPPDSSALLAARRSDKIRAEKRAEKQRLEFDWPSEEKRRRDEKGNGRARAEDEAGVSDGHVNFWAGLEKSAAKPKKTPDQIQADDPTTMYLHRPLRETKPWYTDVALRTYEEREEDEEKRERRERRRRKDDSAKTAQDPMTYVHAALASSSSSTRAASTRRPHPLPLSTNDSPLRAARAARESAERARALALVQARTRDAAVETPRTERADDMGSDLWNRDEVREARRRKEAVRGWRRGVGGR
ncbi:hypothetical protein NliqN6_3635 [Naganishia liquefaciens]|uniref:CBF1-interacting co-repressor CIR N-terminal domain-containing protein n=1 Tax=Naganishia liquefaciens TaxID=104408 RepID=A0A8H3YFF5_9TREE|nr:hypothetical protein NliqN6_3635 [Naganishia liquefaciens]